MMCQVCCYPVLPCPRMAGFGVSTEDVRYYIGPETELPHIYRHGVGEHEVEEGLRTDSGSRR
jgi:hypothetical protein